VDTISTVSDIDHDADAGLRNVEMAEDGFDPTKANPSSGALGLAQALGHGNANTAGSLGNEYGGCGLTDRAGEGC
jgi:hypothetical protein